MKERSRKTQATARLESRLPEHLREEAEVLRLSVEDQRLIAESILHPPEPTANLRRAFERRRKLFVPA